MAVKLPVIQHSAIDVDADLQDSFQKGPVCNGCDLFNEPRVLGQGPSQSDIVIVSESPSWTSAHNRVLYYGKGGQVLRTTIKQLIDVDNKSPTPLGFKDVRKFETYAVQCCADKIGINKPTLERCSLYLHAAIRSRRPKIILTCGANALKAVGIKAQKFNEVRGRVLTTVISGESYTVLPTFSTDAILAKAGIYNLFRSDIIRALKIAAGADTQTTTISFEALTKNYTIPKTIEDVKRICDEIVSYSGQGGNPQTWSIAVDTETNTLRPYRDDAKILCISFAWDDGKATAIPISHEDAPWTEEEVLPYIKAVLECPKPKVFHNAKYDIQMIEESGKLTVNNLRWDTMIGEHYLNENQQGAYSLKVLGRTFFPEFTGYADKIHDTVAADKTGLEDEKKELGGVKKKSAAKGLEEVPLFESKASEVKKYLKGDKKAKKRLNDEGYERVPYDELLVYAAIDTDLTRRLVKHQFKRISDEGCSKVKTLMQNLSIPASRALGKMEYGGFRIDKDYLEYLYEDKLKKAVEETEREIRAHWSGSNIHKEFAINSPADIGYVLYSKGALIDVNGDPDDVRNRKTYLLPHIVKLNEKSGQWKTDKATLRSIYEQTGCRFAEAVLDYRAAFKARNTFLAEMREMIKIDGKLHTTYNLHGTSTGRLSSNGPNMQNIPGYLAGVNIKKIFIPDDPENQVFVNVDYKGAELRVFCAYSKDKKLIDAINAGMDPHSLVAERVYNIPYIDFIDDTDVDIRSGQRGRNNHIKDEDPKRHKQLKLLRTNIKRVVFGILYGAGPRKIAMIIGITEEEAKRIITFVNELFPSVPEYVAATKNHIERYGFVETMEGRRRRFPLATTSSFFKSQGYRQGLNMRIQAQNSDIVLGRLVEMSEAVRELEGRLLVTVHDSIGFQVSKKYTNQLSDFLDYYCVKRVGELYPWLPVEFKCDIEVGRSYGETIKLVDYLKEQDKIKTKEEQQEQVFEEEVFTELREELDDAKAS